MYEEANLGKYSAMVKDSGTAFTRRVSLSCHIGLSADSFKELESFL